MGAPVPFPEANFTWRGWPADDERNEVGDLPSFKDGNQTISCWRLTWRERLRALFTGRVWLSVQGQQPPVYVTGDYPFEKKPPLKEAA